MSITIPTVFTIAQYRLTLAAGEPLPVSLFKGSALRGGFGHTFKRLACRQPWPCDKYCQMGNRCAYGYIFETAPPENTAVLRNFEDVPRPFVIEPPQDSRVRLNGGETLSFGLILVGQGDQYRQNFEDVFRELGRVGLGKASGKYRLMKMELTGQANGMQIMTRAATLPSDRITLNFITPTRLKHRGEWVWQGPPFEVLIKILLGRISSLSYFHCGQAFEADFRGLIDRAAQVRIVQKETRWEDWSRFSGRQKQQIEMGGLVGRITYAGDLRDYLPLLALGELVHVGKGTVFGNGQYEVGVGSKE